MNPTQSIAGERSLENDTAASLLGARCHIHEAVRVASGIRGDAQRLGHLNDTMRLAIQQPPTVSEGQLVVEAGAPTPQATTALVECDAVVRPAVDATHTMLLKRCNQPRRSGRHGTETRGTVLRATPAEYSAEICQPIDRVLVRSSERLSTTSTTSTSSK